jgi:hypothetical protein
LVWAIVIVVVVLAMVFAVETGIARRQVATGVLWLGLLTVAFVSAGDEGRRQLPALVSLYTLPFLAVIPLARGRRWIARPALTAILVPLVFVAVLCAAGVLLIAFGVLIP